MESPTRMPQTLSPCSSSSSSRRLSTDSTSPEFEFWRLRDPSSHPPDLLSADELFSGGVLLPLSLLSLPHHDQEPDQVRQPPSNPELEPPSASSDEAKPTEEARVGADAGPPTASKRWRDIFKKAEKKPDGGGSRERSEKKKKKKEKRGQGGSGSPELNINIWPFSRSRSAGNGGSRPRTAAAGSRKVSSAPCSRSNSAGENKTRKWPSSPGRAGVHLGRSSPVWQMKRTGSSGLKGCDLITRSTDKVLSNKESGGEGPRRSQAAVGGSRWGGRASGGGTKARVLNLNVPMCIGYRQHLSCRGGDSSAIAVGTGGGETASGVGVGGGSGGVEGVVGGGGSSNNLFNLRSLFTKKVY